MASTYTTNKSIEKPANGDYVNTWSTPVNSDWDIIDTSLGGTTTLNATGASGTVTLSTSQYRPPTIIITGVLTSNVTYRIPSGVGGHWVIYNNTSGAFTITIDSGGGGTSTTVAQGFRVLVYSDGTNIGPGITSVPLAAAGASGQVQFNSSGSLAGSSNLTYDGTGNLVLGAVTPGRLDVRNAFRIYGSTSGYFGLTVPAAAGSTTYTLPNTDGTSGQALTTNGSGTLSWTTVSGGVAGVTSFSAGTTGLTPAGASTGAVVLAGTLAVANGGTGSSSTQYCSLTTNVTGTLPVANGGTGQTSYTDGQLLIGNTVGNTLTKANLTAGSGVTITNGNGSITIAATGSGGTVTSVNASGGTTGMSFSGGPVTSSGTLTLSGTLAVANGGTGATTASTARTNLGLAIGTDIPSPTGTGASGTWGISISGNAATVTNGVYTNGSYADPTWITSLAGSKVTGNISGNAANVTGTVAVANGGTGATTASNARTNLGLAIGTDIPSPTGTGASGTWSINVTGSAGTATTATNLSGGTVTASAGTVSAPSITTTGDTNTGIFFPAADTIAITTGGVESTRFNSSGDVFMNCTANLVSSAVLHVDTAGATYGSTVELKNQDDSRPCIINWNSATSNDNQFVAFGTETAYTFRGSITYNRGAGLVAYNTSSDRRSKTIYGPVTTSGSMIDNLNVYMGKMNSGTDIYPMMIADEMQQVVPYSVTGQPNAVNPDGSPKYQQVDYSSLVPLLIAEIKSLRDRVQVLEGTV